jgi:hypothetical protein
MSLPFRQTRNVELSTIDYLTTYIKAGWSNINVVKTFSQVSEKSLPVVCIRLVDNNPFRLEVGSDTLENRYGLIIDIFATSDGQRLDLADYITEGIKSGWTYSVFSQTSGDPETLDKTASGRVQMVKITRNSKLDFSDSVESRDRFRHLISLIVRKA